MVIVVLWLSGPMSVPTLPRVVAVAVIVRLSGYCSVIVVAFFVFAETCGDVSGE